METTTHGRQPPAAARFSTTRWSVVLAAAGDSPGAASALAQLCERYWPPVYAFVRRRGYSRDEAHDLTQGFFTRLIDKNDVADADRDRGRFRTFLLTSCRNFLANEWHRSRRLKRGGDAVAMPIDLAVAEGRVERALSHGETPERLFDRQWCLTLLDGVLDGLREEYAAGGRQRIFDRLRGYLTFDESAGSYAEAAAELGMTPAAVKVAVYRLRGRYREALRRAVADTVAPRGKHDGEIASAIDGEIRFLIETLRS